MNLRIDDTDTERNREQFIALIKEDLNWLGITWAKCYRQSQQSYTTEIEYLKSIGRIYPCYETQEEIESQRKIQEAMGVPPRYQPCAKDQSRAPHWRFKLEHVTETWDDEILGLQKHHGSEFSDPVVIREDGVILYNLASVIDDHRDGITFILRGADHVCNTVSQIQILRALDKNSTITWAHMPLMTNSRGEKFSKRDQKNQNTIQFMRYRGYEPMALVYALLEVGKKSEVSFAKNLEELAKTFKLDYSNAPSSWDAENCRRWQLKLNHAKTTEEGILWAQAQGWKEITNAEWNIVKELVGNRDDSIYWRTVFTDHEFYVPAIYSYEKEIRITALELGSCEINAIMARLPSYSKEEICAALRRAITGHAHGPKLSDLTAAISQQILYKRLAC